MKLVLGTLVRNNNKVGFFIADTDLGVEQNVDYVDIGNIEFRRYLENGWLSIANIELKGNIPTMKNWNPARRGVWCCSREVDDNTEFRGYCYIEKTMENLFNIMALSISGELIKIENSTIADIENRLDKSIEDIKFLNAYMDDKGHMCIYKPSTGTYFTSGIGVSRSANIDAILDSEIWSAEVNVDNLGVVIYKLKQKRNKSSRGIELDLKAPIIALGKFSGGADIVKVGPTVRKLGPGCFEDTHIGEVNLAMDGSLAEIPDKCFKKSSIMSFKGAGSVQIIGRQAFMGCTKLIQGIVIDSSIVSDEAFRGCGITRLKVCSANRKIGDAAFEGCKNLKKVAIMDGNTSIGKAAFMNCTRLQEIRLPRTLETVAYSALRNCKSLKTLKVYESSEINIEKLVNVTGSKNVDVLRYGNSDM